MRTRNMTPKGLAIFEHKHMDVSRGSTWHYPGPGQRSSAGPGLQGQGHGSCSSTCQIAESMPLDTTPCPAFDSKLSSSLLHARLVVNAVVLPRWDVFLGKVLRLRELQTAVTLSACWYVQAVLHADSGIDYKPRVWWICSPVS